MEEGSTVPACCIDPASYPQTSGIIIWCCLEAGMGHKKAGVPGRRYTKEFKIEAVRLGQSVGDPEASRRLGMPESSLFNWVKLDRANKLGPSRGVSAAPRSAKELEAEVNRLRRELATAKVDNDILKNGLFVNPSG
jgi:transposase